MWGEDPLYPRDEGKPFKTWWESSDEFWPGVKEKLFHRNDSRGLP